MMMTERVTADYGYEQTIRMTQMHDVPTAIVAGGPLLSGVLRALARTRMRILRTCRSLRPAIRIWLS